jgi:hypothetical protein
VLVRPRICVEMVILHVVECASVPGVRAAF